MIKKTIVALDQMSKDEINNLMPTLKPFEIFKLGLEVFNAYGKDLVHDFSTQYQKKIFLDLKLHDIPKTVERAIASLHGLDIQYLTIHLSGGENMIQSAMNARDRFLPSTKILGVSYLTSLGKNDFKEIYSLEAEQIEEQFFRIFRLAAKSQLDGLISSAHEISIIKKVESLTNHQFLKVTPAIRMPGFSQMHDQQRVMTPRDAFSQGSDLIVMGRSITQSQDIGSVIDYLSKTIS